MTEKEKYHDLLHSVGEAMGVGVIISTPEPRALEVLMQLDALGVRLSIDDFGKGYSSLAYLKRLPVSEIKIDKSFVMNMAEDENDALIVHSTIELAHNLGLKVLAEGVVNEEVWNTLKNLGCDSAQGHYISPPVSARDFTRWLKESGWGIQRKDAGEKQPFGR
ncbi:phytochrome-like protein cph2 [bacterium BMS3Abin10]|nr:phytochrome-like protein cph2 [bacterium BMS3Abin10]GBE38114.1 phytochrome-like protein cph2 [bacterium BMS3Bbin08]